MTGVQITRDSVDREDEVRAPHVAVIRLQEAATMADVASWIEAHDYLAGTPEGESWLLHTSSRVGPGAARLTTQTDGRVAVTWLGDSHLPLDGVGSLHLERECSGADVLGD